MGENQNICHDTVVPRTPPPPYSSVVPPDFLLAHRSNQNHIRGNNLHRNAAPIFSDWMNDSLSGTPKCPPGLGYLTQVDHLMVKERVRFLASNDTFTVKNSSGQNIYWATEEPNCCVRGCFGASRPFDVKIMNVQSHEVMHFYRRIHMGYRDSIEVSAPLGRVIGRVKEDWTVLRHRFTIKNHENKPVLRIEAPFFKSSLFGDAEFKILLLDGTQIGKISKKWAGLARELFTDGHYYGITFPLELDVRLKAVLLGACIMINSRFYERL